MVRLEFSTELSHEADEFGADFIFNVRAARTPRQTIVSERLELSQNVPASQYTDPVTNSRLLQLHVQTGPFTLRFAAVVGIDHFQAQPGQLMASSVHILPGAVLPYLCPGRYYQSNRLLMLASREFRLGARL